MRWSVFPSTKFYPIKLPKETQAKLISGDIINNHIGETKITLEDVGKVFVLLKDGGRKVMTHEELSKMNPVSIEGWTYLGLFDVNC